MNVYKRCACVETCGHAYHFKFEHRGRPFRESTHTANFKLAGRVAHRRYTDVVGRAAGVSDHTDLRRVRLSDLQAKYDEWVVVNHRIPGHAQAIIRHFCAFYPDDPYVADLQAFDLERWRSARLRSVQKSTLHSQFGIVQGMFRQATIWYPGMRRIDLGVSTARPDEAEVAILTPDELHYTLTELPPLLALIARVTLETLARISEVVGLTVHDVGPNWMQRRLKGGKRLRIEITPALATALRADLRPGQVQLFEVPVRQPRQRPAAWRPLTRALASQRFTLWFARHHLRHLHHHCYRHTGISLMLERGENPKTIQQLAGWTSLAMLPRYGHVGNREMARAVFGNAAHLEAVLNRPAVAEARGGHTNGHTRASGGHKNGHTPSGLSRKS